MITRHRLTPRAGMLEQRIIMIQRFNVSIAMMSLVLAVGCTGGDSVQPIETDGAEFSSAKDYEAYDLEMAKLSEGQPE